MPLQARVRKEVALPRPVLVLRSIVPVRQVVSESLDSLNLHDVPLSFSPIDGIPLVLSPNLNRERYGQF